MQTPATADLEQVLIANGVHTRLFGGDERPTRLGPYVIVRRIGGGAMGDVFLGYHESLDRKAAIKLVRPAAEDSTVERRRLLREARVLAKIDHPNVISVHDSGTHDNRVYLAMAYVAGPTLAVWQQGRPWRVVLGAYLKAGRGLQAVHAVVLDDGADAPRRGLCHRDFKPDNVLVDEHGEVRVADFGLAVPTHRREPDADGVARPLDLRLTADASVVGTPLYISPEQLRGGPGDARSDQYSFCVALYEALYGQHPYYAPTPSTRASDLPTASSGPGGTTPRFALFEAILGAPLRPAPRGKVPRRIYSVLVRGLQRDPAHRYPSMAALLAALERDLTRPLFAGLTGALALALAVGLGMAANRAPAMCSNVAQETAALWDDARQAAVQDAFLATGAGYAASSFAAVDRQVRAYLERWTAVRQAACDATQRDGAEPLATQQRSMACLAQQLDAARLVLDDLAVVAPGTLASAGDRVAALPDPGQCDARHLYARGCNLEAPTDPAVARVRPLIQAAQDEERAGHFVAAEALAARAAAAAHAEALPSLVVDAEFTRGRILTELGRPVPALDALMTARDVAEAASCDAATVDLDAYTAKLVALQPRLDLGFGEHAIHTGLARLRRDGHDDRAREAQLRSDSGLLYEYRRGDVTAAEHDYREALALRDTEELRNTPAQARTLQNLGTILSIQQRYPEALAVLNDALALYRSIYGEDHPALWKPLFNIGVTQYEADQLPEAEATLTRSLALAQAALGEDSPDVRDIHGALANIALDRGNGPLAQQHANVGLVDCAIHDRHLPPNCADLRRQLAHARYLQGDHLDALQIRLQLLTDLRIRGLEVAEQHIELAASYIALEDWQQALAQVRLAEVKLAKRGDRRPPQLALLLGEALLGLRRSDDASAAFAQALALSADDPGLHAAAAWGSARALCKSGGAELEAKRSAREALTYFETDADDPETAALVENIDALLHSGCLFNPKR